MKNAWKAYMRTAKTQDPTAHLRILIRVFAVSLFNHWVHLLEKWKANVFLNQRCCAFWPRPCIFRQGLDDPILYGISHYISHPTKTQIWGSIHAVWSEYSLFAWRKHAYLNILKFLQPKKENFQMKNFTISHNSAQNIDCGYSLEPPRRGGSNEYPNLCFEQKYEKLCIPL